MSQKKDEEKKRKQQQQAAIDVFMLQMIEKSMKSPLDAAMKDLFKDWK